MGFLDAAAATLQRSGGVRPRWAGCIRLIPKSAVMRANVACNIDAAKPTSHDLERGGAKCFGNLNLIGLLHS
jgi:hypothetical protein